MLYGDQWQCKCGTWNMTLRKNCRECGHPQSEAVKTEDSLQMVNRVSKMTAKEIDKDPSEKAQDN